MRRREPAEVESAGHESFLDVVTNIVCILIILVMIVGQHAKTLIVAEASAPPPLPRAALDAQQTAAAMEQDIHELEQEIATVRQTAAARHFERDQLSTLLTAGEMELSKRRAALDEEAKHKFDHDRDKALARADLDRLQKEIKNLASAESTVKIENYPTPISRTVDEKEVHFQLRKGRIVYVPFNEFISKLHAVFEEKAYNKLRDNDEFTETMGPIGDFTVRYTLARVEVPWDEAVKTGQRGSFVQLSEFHFYPLASEIGEPVKEAMGRASMFRGKLEEFNPRHYTITFWIYPDSFDDFHLVRKELYQLGYGVAARPIPEGRNIGGSPNGSKSAAE